MSDDPSARQLPPAALRAFAEQIKSVLHATAEVALLTPGGRLLWSSFDAGVLDDKLLERVRAALKSRNRCAWVIDAARLLATVPVLADDDVVGTILLPVAPNAGESLDRTLARTARRLRPVLDRLGRQLAQRGEPQAGAAPAERSDELDWLFEISAEVHSARDKAAALERLLAGAVDRMDASFGALTIPKERLSLTSYSGGTEDSDSARAYHAAHIHIMGQVQRHCAPLTDLRLPAESGRSACKIMAVPIACRFESDVGAIAFCKRASEPDFDRTQRALARHLARLLESLRDGRYDPATGLLARTALEERAAGIIAARAEDQYAAVYIDIDNLHVVNEAFGFDFGDQAIVYIANFMRPPHLPPKAICGRIAGDRFVVFLPACDTSRALSWARSLQREVKKLTVGLHPQRVTLSVSCGIAGVCETGAAFAKAMAAAEVACRTAKERGRDRSEVYLDVDDSMMHRKEDVLSAMRLRAALEKDRLQIFAQRVVPVRDLAHTGTIECLVRLTAEDGAIVPPAEFLCAARRYQLSRAIDEWMLVHTLAALQPHAAMLFHGEIRVALNISEQSLCEDDFLTYVEDHLGRCDIAPGVLMFEIADEVAGRHAARTKAVVQRLRRMGCRAALDNFSSSPASLNRLQHLPVDRLKIDGSIVRDVLGSAAAEDAVRCMVKLARELELECVAEHVESAALVQKLRELGVEHVQGNALHEAEPLANVLRLLRHEELQQLERLSHWR